MNNYYLYENQCFRYFQFKKSIFKSHIYLYISFQNKFFTLK